MRKVMIGDYDTGAKGWTLSGCQLAPAEWRENLIEVPGMDGVLDASAALTGAVTYAPRLLELTLERSDGTRTTRTAALDELVNSLDGQVLHIILPDDVQHYLTGRVRVAPQYNDLAHAQVLISANCDPWRYKVAATTVARSDLGTAYKHLPLPNERRPVIPTITVEQSTTLLWGGNTIALSAGTYHRADICLAAGANILKAKVASGVGTISVGYQEARL